VIRHETSRPGTHEADFSQTGDPGGPFMPPVNFGAHRTGETLALRTPRLACRAPAGASWTRNDAS